MPNWGPGLEPPLTDAELAVKLRELADAIHALARQVETRTAGK